MSPDRSHLSGRLMIFDVLYYTHSLALRTKVADTTEWVKTQVEKDLKAYL